MTDEEEPTLLHLQAFPGIRSAKAGVPNDLIKSAFDFSEHSGTLKMGVAAGQHTILSGMDNSVTEPDCVFLDTHKRCCEVIAMKADPTRQMLAVCERVRKPLLESTASTYIAQAQISVYHTTSRQCLRALTFKPSAPKKDDTTFDFRCCAWSGDNVYVVGYAAWQDGSDGHIVLYKWKSKKAIASARLPPGVTIESISIDPTSHLRADGTLAHLSALNIIAIGNNYLRSWKPIGEGVLKEIPLVHSKREADHFVDMTWLGNSRFGAAAVRKQKENKLAVLASSGNIYIIARHTSDLSSAFANDSRSPQVRTGSALGKLGAEGSTSVASAQEVWELKAVLQFACPEDLLAKACEDKAFSDRILSKTRSGSATDKSALLRTALSMFKATSISGTAKGFLVTTNVGCVAVFERSDTYSGSRVKARHTSESTRSDLIPSALSLQNSDPYVMIKSFSLPQYPDLPRIIVNDEQVAVLSLQHGILCTNLTAIEALEDNMCTADFETSPLYGRGMHVGGITALAGCTGAGRVVSAALDRTCRVWNYTRSSCEALHTFQLEDDAAADGSGKGGSAPAAGAVPRDLTVDAMSLHPAGYMLAVGQKHCLHVYNACATSLHVWRDMPLRNVSAVAYSTGGGFLAVASGASLHILNAFTLETVHLMNAHAAAIRDIAWSVDDRIVASAGDDGAVFVWNMITGKREEHFCNLIKGVKFTSVALVCTSISATATELANVYGDSKRGASTNERDPRRNSLTTPSNSDNPLLTVKAIVAAGKGAANILYVCTAPDGQITKYNTDSTQITKLAYDERGNKVYAGTVDGSVNVYDWPLPITEAIPQPITEAAVRAVPATSSGSTGDGIPSKGVKQTRITAKDERATEATDAGALTASAAAGCLTSPSCTQYHLHVGAITGLHLSTDSKYIVTSGEDGAIFLLGVPYHDAAKGKIDRIIAASGAAEREAEAAEANESGAGKTRNILASVNRFIGWQWEPTAPKLLNNAVTMLPRVTFEDCMQRLATCDNVLKEARDDAARSLARANSEFAAKLSTITEQAEMAIAAERAKYDSLASRHEAYVRESVAAREKAEVDAVKLLTETSNRYERKLAAEAQRYDELQEEVIAVRQAAEEALSKAEIERKSQVTALLASANKRQQDLESMIFKLKAGLRESEERHHAVLEDAEKENEDYISKMKVNMELALLEEGKKASDKGNLATKLSKQLGMMNKQIQALEREVDALKADNAAKELKISQLQEQLRSAGRVMEEQSSALLDKEKDMGSLRSEKRTLEAFRFVLDHRLAELDADRGPVLEHVAKLEAHVKSVYEELVSKFRESKDTDQSVVHLSEKLQVVAAELKKARATVTERETLLTNVLREIDDLAHGPDAELRDGVSYLVTKYVRGMKTSHVRLTGATVLANSTGVVALQEHRDTMNEVVRQREFMRREAAALAKQATSIAKVAGNKAAVSVADNLALMDEANMLRQEVVFQRRKLAGVSSVTSVKPLQSIATPLKSGTTPKRHAMSSSSLPALTKP